MVPLTAQGHLNQLLHLSRLISTYNLPIYFVSTTAHIHQAKTRVHVWDPLTVPNMHFHELSTPPYDVAAPDPTSGIKFPKQLVPLFKSLTNLCDPFYALTQKLSLAARKIVVIYDLMMADVVQDAHSIPNTEAYSFQSTSAFFSYAICWEMSGKPLHGLPAEVETVLKQVPSMEGCDDPEFLKVSVFLSNVPELKSGDIFNTARVIDGLYLDLFGKDNLAGIDKRWPLGPFNPIFMLEDTSDSSNKILKWLDKQDENSVVFVSFGTTSSITDEQIHEIAAGLEKREQKFIWVLRDADKGEVFDGKVRKAQLPQGYEERIQDRGIIVRDWAPQLEVLGHRLWAFISHCGWSSCIESISLGVPVGTWPMHSDQPSNAVLITKVLRVGIEVREWERRDEFLSSTELEKAVRRLMASAEGDEIRIRAAELGDAVGKSVMEGGDSCNQMDSFIAHFSR